MKKSIISIALVLCILFAVASPFAAHATEPETFMVPNYQMYQKFMADTYPVLFRDRLYLATLDSLTGLDKCIGAASVLIEEDLSVERCIQILANMATLMNYQLEEAIVEQATVDTTMTLSNYGVKAADIAAGIVGADSLKKAANSVMQGIATTMGIANGVLDVTVDTKEKLELLVQLQGDYSMQYAFLEAIYVYADIPEMKEAAQTLMLANEQIMLHKLEVFNSTTSSATKFAAHDVFLDQVAEDLLNDPDFFDSDAWLGVKALSTAYSLYSGGKLAFDITLFLGDVMFGVHDIYNRYNEMVAMRDIRQALFSRVEGNPALNEEDYDNMDRNISLMKMSLYIDVRGEYCVYKMIAEDGKLAKLFSTTNQKSIEDNYNASVRLIENSFGNLEMLYCEKEWGNSINTRKLTQINKYIEGNIQTETYIYYNDKNQITQIDSDTYGEYSGTSKTVLTYDNQGNLVSRISGDAGMNFGTQYTYNSRGQVERIDSWEGGAGETLYEYDFDGRAKKKTEISDIGTYITEYIYDAEGRVVGAERTCTEEGEVPWTETIIYSYDSENCLIQEVCESEYVRTSKRYDYSFVNLVIEEYLINDERSEVFVNYYDANGNDACGISLWNPRFYADAEGYLAKIVDTYSSYGKVETIIYELYYDDILSVPFDNPADTSIIYEEVVSHTYEEAEKLLYEFLGNDYGYEGLEVRQVSENGKFEMTISGDGGAPIYVIYWYTVNLDTGEVRNAETYSVVCDLW